MKPSDGAPEYVSYDDWQNSAHKRRVKFRLRALYFALGILAALGFVFGSGVFRRAQIQNAILASLSKLRDYRIDVELVGAGGKSTPWSSETHLGNDWQLSLWDGKMVFTKHGAIFYTDDTVGRTSNAYSAWDGSRTFIEQAMGAIRHLNPWRLASREPWFRSARIGDGGTNYTFHSYDGDWEITENSAAFPTRITFSSGSFDGLAPNEVATITTSNLRLAPYNLFPLKPFGTGKEQVIKGASNNAVRIAAADIDVRGDAYFCFTGDAVSGARNIFRAKGDRYYDIGNYSVQGLKKPVTEIEFVATDAYPAIWPTTLHIYLVTQDRKEVDFMYTFRRPTCYLLPQYDVGSGGDRPYVQVLRDFTGEQISIYYDRVIRINGQPVIPRDPFHSKGVPILADKEEGLRLSFLAVHCDHELDDPDDADSRQPLLRDWLDIGARLRDIDGDDSMRQAIIDADGLVPANFNATGLESQVLLQSRVLFSQAH